MAGSLEKILQNLETDTGETGTSKKLKRSELSMDINDILSLDLDEPPLKTKEERKSVKPEKVKCCPIILGGVDLTSKSTRLSALRSCSSLLCRNCDFPVSSFPNHEWIEPVDYLFLRTEMPNFQKISTKLKRKDGAIAYACHCVSFFSKQVETLPENLPWFCRGHV